MSIDPVTIQLRVWLLFWRNLSANLQPHILFERVRFLTGLMSRSRTDAWRSGATLEPFFSSSMLILGRFVAVLLARRVLPSWSAS